MTDYIYVKKEGIALDTSFRFPTENYATAEAVPLIVDLDHDNDASQAKTSPHTIAIDAEHAELPESLTIVPVRQLISQWSNAQLHQAFRAIQLVRWQRDHVFCSRCGTKTIADATETAAVCPQCDYRQYPRVQPCVIVAITKMENGIPKILLAKNKDFPLPFYSVIAGFVEAGETLEHAVTRETFEETGLKLKNITYMGSQPWPFPSNLMIAFHAEYASGEIHLAEDELEDADFYPFDALPMIPPQGSIAHSMIHHICFDAPLNL